MRRGILYTMMLGLIISGYSGMQNIAFAEDSIEIRSYKDSITSLENILILGTISGGNLYKPVQITVLDPNGIVLYKPSIAFDGDGNFKKLFQPPISGFSTGIHTVIVSHEDIVQTDELQFTVIGAPLIDRAPSQIADGIVKEVESPFSLYADAVLGSSMINISGMARSQDGDVTVQVTAPNGNLISIAQVTPSTSGQFSLEIITGGPLWIQDGNYSVTVFQGSTSELRESVQVEIQDGVVIPEFGSMVAVILAISIISIVVVSSKFTRLRIQI